VRRFPLRRETPAHDPAGLCPEAGTLPWMRPQPRQQDDRAPPPGAGRAHSRPPRRPSPAPCASASAAPPRRLTDRHWGAGTAPSSRDDADLCAGGAGGLRRTGRAGARRGQRRTLRPALDAALALRHAMGCTRHHAHTLLAQFVVVLAPHAAAFLTTDGAGRGALQPPPGQPAEWARRLRVGRGLAQSHSALAPRTAIPPPALLPSRPHRRAPSRSSDAESPQGRAAARPLPSATGLRACTSATVFGVRAVTGRRRRAPLALDNDDVALEDGLLPMRHTTLRTSRCLPLHPLGGTGHVRPALPPDRLAWPARQPWATLA
jgi:hypothetical protein